LARVGHREKFQLKKQRMPVLQFSQSFVPRQRRPPKRERP
jgi:hypothetical protein